MFCAFNLTAALGDVDAAVAARKAFLDSLDLDANGKLDTAKTGDAVSLDDEATAVGAQTDKAEAAVKTVMNTGTGTAIKPIALKDADLNALSDGTDLTLDGTAYGKGASDAIQDSILATQKLILAAAVKDAAADLAAVTKEIAKTANLQAAVDGVISAQTSADATAKAEAATVIKLTAAEVEFDATNTKGASTGDVGNLVLSTALAYSATTGKFDAVTITYDIDNDGTGVGKKADITLATISDKGVVTLDATQTDISSAEFAALKTALENELAALKADGDAQALLKARLGTLNTVNDASVNDANKALEGIALDYVNATGNVKALNTLTSDLDAAVAKVTEARANTTELKSLDDAITATEKVITDAGYAVVTLVDKGNVGASADNDVFLLSTLKTVDVPVLDVSDGATINNFGFAGSDVIVATGYSLGGTTGDDSKLEVFVKQVGANTVLTFEESAFGSNAASAETFTVTLTGVASADVHLSNGYITVA